MAIYTYSYNVVIDNRRGANGEKVPQIAAIEDSARRFINHSTFTAFEQSWLERFPDQVGRYEVVEVFARDVADAARVALIGKTVCNQCEEDVDPDSITEEDCCQPCWDVHFKAGYERAHADEWREYEYVYGEQYGDYERYGPDQITWADIARMEA